MHFWVFDLDGTLVDSFAHYFAALSEIFEGHGVAFSAEHHHPALTESFETFFGRHLGPEKIAPSIERIRSRSNDDAALIRPFDGVTQLLTALRERGDQVSIWTNRDRESAELIIKQTRLDQLSETWISGTCVTDRKPHPEGLTTIMQRLGCEDPKRVTMIGDHEHDMLGAKAYGARAVRASWHGYWTMPACTLADKQFHTFAEFANWARAAQR